MPKKKTNIDDKSKLILSLIPTIKDNDHISIYDPKSVILGCNWENGFWLNGKFNGYSIGILPKFVSDINLIDITKSNVYHIMKGEVTISYSPKEYSLDDLDEDQRLVYNHYKQLMNTKQIKSITDMWDYLWRTLDGFHISESYLNWSIKKIKTIYECENK